jgi:hypothetical protein
MALRCIHLFLILTSSFSLFSCAGNSHPRLISPSEGPGSPPYLQLYSEKQIATLHFPAGVYTLSAADKIGYYYRAPRKIVEQGSIGRAAESLSANEIRTSCAGIFIALEQLRTSAIFPKSDIDSLAKTFQPNSPLIAEI